MSEQYIRKQVCGYLVVTMLLWEAQAAPELVTAQLLPLSLQPLHVIRSWTKTPLHNSCHAQMSWQFLDIKHVRNLWSDIQAYAF